MSFAPLPASHVDYAEIARLVDSILKSAGGVDRFKEKIPSFLREAIDEVIDTKRTGRLFLAQTEKTEKTYLGTKVEILLRDFLELPKGIKLDLLIDSTDVDVKSTMRNNWMIPMEAVGQPCLLVKLDEKKSQCSVGMIIAHAHYLNKPNRDKKRSISSSGATNIWWILRNFSFPENFWHKLSPAKSALILGQNSGAKRVAMLFELVQRTPISRVQVEAVAKQDDFMKRIRKNGGARDILSKKGIAVLYSEIDRELMKACGITSIGYREFISIQPTDAPTILKLRAAKKIV